jgi:hypothetical protein
MLRCAAELTDSEVSKKHWDLLEFQTTRTPNLNYVETSKSHIWNVYSTHIRTYIHTHIQTHTHTHTHITYTRKQPEECLYSQA